MKIGPHETRCIYSIGCLQLVVLLVVVVAGYLIQVVLIPATPWHAGDGLLLGGDWIYFHYLAEEVSRLIALNGWSAWSLRPDGQAPAGIAAAIYAFTGIHQPWVVLPINALVFSAAVACFYSSMLVVAPVRRLALLATLPMLLMPSMALVWGQLHKDVWALFGVLAVLAVWIRALALQPLPLIWGVLLVILGNFSIWLVRPYAMQLLLLGQLGMFAIVGLSGVHRRSVCCLLSCLCCILFTALTSVFGKTSVLQVESDQYAPVLLCPQWVNTIPVAGLENAFASLACTRHTLAQSYPDAGSTLDKDVSLHSAVDLLAYMPRALQVGFLAPFPSMWLEGAASPAGRVMRLIAGFEMMGLYFALGGIVLNLWMRRRAGTKKTDTSHVVTAAVLVFSICWVLVYSLATSNVGSLYRVRLPIMVLLFGFGCIAWFHILKRKST
jgi:hypothetical protein